MGRIKESVSDFVHGACNYPGAAPLIAGRRAKAPGTSDEARDRRVGSNSLQNPATYLARNGSRARRFFATLTAAPRFVALMSQIEKTRRCHGLQTEAACSDYPPPGVPIYSRARAFDGTT